MELEDLSYLVLILGVVVIGFITLQNDLSENTNITIDNSFNETYNKINEESQRINQSESLLFSTGVDSTFSFMPTVQSFIGVGSLMKGSLQVLNQMINNVAEYFGVPAFIVTALSSMLLIAFVFAIFKATLGRLFL